MVEDERLSCFDKLVFQGWRWEGCVLVPGHACSVFGMST